MALFVVVEIAVFIVTVPFLWYFTAKTAIGKALFASMFAAAALEIVNETVFDGVGTFYPDVLLTFPFFNFPVAIILMGGFYSGIINFSALKAAKLFKSRFLRATVFLIAAALMNLLSIAVESAGIYSGLWKHSQPTGISTIYFAVYLYYLIIVFSASVFIFCGLLKKDSYSQK